MLLIFVTFSDVLFLLTRIKLVSDQLIHFSAIVIKNWFPVATAFQRFGFFLEYLGNRTRRMFIN